MKTTSENLSKVKRQSILISYLIETPLIDGCTVNLQRNDSKIK